MKLRSLPPPLKPGFRHWQGIRWQCLGWPPPCLPQRLWAYRAWSSLSAKLLSALCHKKASPLCVYSFRLGCWPSPTSLASLLKLTSARA